MKYLRIILLVFLLPSCILVRAQSTEVQQLLLNVTKLAQLKDILNNMYRGYETVSRGYTAIRDISQGNFNLHDVFLNSLLQVSPTVRNYKRVADIVSCQLKIAGEYRSAYNRFKQNGNFTSKEIAYMGKVYSHLLDESLKDMDALLMVITSGSLRMSDDERLTGIDGIYSNIKDKLTFLRHFNSDAGILSLQRDRAQKQVTTLKKIYSLP